VTPEIAARLAACDILMAAQAQDYCMFVRGNCVALVQSVPGAIHLSRQFRHDDGKGLGLPCVDRRRRRWLSRMAIQVEADAEQVDAIRKFPEEA
jgi:hypothetical protein